MTEDLGQKNEFLRIKDKKSLCIVEKLLLFIVKGDAVKSNDTFDVIPVKAGNIGCSSQFSGSLDGIHTILHPLTYNL